MASALRVPDEMMTSGRNIIVGIDFGTTYTAAAWADTLNPSHIEVIKNWPTAGAVVNSQVPTEIAYEPEDRNRFSWGYNIKPQSEKVRYYGARGYGLYVDVALDQMVQAQS